MSKEGLLIVDPQKCFMPEGELAVPNGDEVVEPINSSIEFARERNMPIAMSRDWHPEETVHFENWPKHGVQNTKGAEFHDDIDIEGVEIFSKGMSPEEDSYSAFDGVNEEGLSLEEYFRRAQVLKLFVAGLATDYCVKASALSALAKGFEVTLLSDAIRAVDINPDDGEKAIKEMTDAGIKIITSKELISK